MYQYGVNFIMLNFENLSFEQADLSFTELPADAPMPFPEWMHSSSTGIFDFLINDISLPSAVNDNFEKYLATISEGPGVYEYIIKYCNVTGYDEVSLYQKAALQKSTFSKLRNMRKTHYLPSKYPTIVCLALAMELNVTDIQAFVNLAGYHMSNAIKPDKIVMYCVKQHEFSVDKINEYLYKATGKAWLIPERAY